MKLHRLTMENLNSLYGKWSIDFTHPSFLAEGLFAITGPTGAGKSTILDALCLALYGSTPRLGRITKSANQIMSRQTGECSAEVIFQTPEGIFRCFWGQHRARKKAEGKLAEARHEISNAETGEILGSKKKDTEALVEKITGMDFQRFTRSILLAQGSFDAFLKADADQRSPILEQITGTEIYSTFSVFLHERLRREKEQWQILQAESSGIELLTPEAEEALQSELSETRNREEVLRQQMTEQSREIRLREEFLALQEEQKQKETALAELQKEQQSFLPRRKELEEALKASELEGEFAALESLRQQFIQLENNRKSLGESILHLEAQLEENRLHHGKAGEELDAAQKQGEAEKRSARELRELDLRLAGMRETLQQCLQDRQRLEEQQQRLQEESRQNQETQEALTREQQELSSWSRDKEQLSGLEGEMTGLRELLLRIGEGAAEKASLQERQICLSAEEARSREELSLCNRAMDEKRKLMAEQERFCRDRESLLKKLLQDSSIKDLRREQEGLLRESALIQKILRLEEEREKLVQDQPCPLCGSTEHPFAREDQSHELPTGRLEELGALLQKAESLQEELEEGKKQLESLRLQAMQSEKEQLQAATAAGELQQEEQRLQQDLIRLEEQKNQALDKLEQRLSPLGIDLPRPLDTESFQQELESLLEQWKNLKEQQNRLEEKLKEGENQARNLQQMLHSLEPEHKRLEEKYRSQETLLQEAEKERLERFGKRQPGEMEQQAEAALERARRALNQAAERLTAAQEQLLSQKKQQEKLVQTLKELEEARNRAQQGFAERCHNAGFSAEAQWLAARMPAESRRTLEQQAMEMDRRQTVLESRLEVIRDLLTQGKEANRGDTEALNKLREALKEEEVRLKELLEAGGALGQRLKDHREKTRQLQDRKEKLEQATRECRKWERLHGLIGSSDGKKYRNFAQGLTFERMVGLANRQLRKMSDRYLLLRDEEAPLELNVIDNYQGGEIRSTRNLSGGESFLVSLALALGLSGLSSRHIQMESLFLDEGFGTLDEDSLETALETLSELQQQGKLIGIISHVPVIRERLGTQIQILRSSAGRSRISGPGCVRVKESAVVS